MAHSTSAAQAEWAWTIDAARSRQLRPMLTWAEEEIVVPNGPYQGEPFNASLIPWTRLFLQEVDTGHWTKIAGTGCTQGGKTLVEHAIPVLYHLFEAGETVVEGVPDMLMGGDKWREDLLPVIQASPNLREQLPTRGAGSKGGKVQSVKFRHGATLRFMTGHGSDAGRKGFTSRVLAVTEVDELAVAGGTSSEADKLTQLEGRLRAFLRLGIREYLESTPTVPTGRIWQEILNGTNSRIARPCPHCGDWVTPEREHVGGWQDAKDEREAKNLACWSCPSCGEPWTEQQQFEANRHSVLVHRGQAVTPSGRVEGPLPQTDTFGFRFSAVDNHLVPVGVIGQELWRAARALDQDNAERYLCQQVFALPWQGEETSLLSLDPETLCRRVDVYKRGVVPEDTDVVGIGVDTGKRVLHWTAAAASGIEGRRHLVDYGEQPTPWQTLSTEESLVAAIRELHGYLFAGFQRSGASDLVLPTAVWVDSGYHEHTAGIYRACRELNTLLGCKRGEEVYRPTKGHGEGPEHDSPYRPPRQLSRDIRLIGERYHFSYLAKAAQCLVHLDADHWKTQLHEGLAAPIDDPRAVVLFATASPEEHTDFNGQVTAEERVEEYVTGKGVRRRWNRIRRKNHYLDSSYSALAAVTHAAGVAAKQRARAASQGWFSQQKDRTRR